MYPISDSISVKEIAVLPIPTGNLWKDSAYINLRIELPILPNYVKYP